MGTKVFSKLRSVFGSVILTSISLSLLVSSFVPMAVADPVEPDVNLAGEVIDCSSQPTESARKNCVFLNLQQGKKLQSGDTSSISKDDYFFFGVYASNYYIPFKTVVSSQGTWAAQQFQSTQELIGRVFTENLKFTEGVAKNLTSAILSEMDVNGGGSVELQCAMSEVSDPQSTDLNGAAWPYGVCNWPLFMTQTPVWKGTPSGNAWTTQGDFPYKSLYYELNGEKIPVLTISNTPSGHNPTKGDLALQTAIEYSSMADSSGEGYRPVYSSLYDLDAESWDTFVQNASDLNSDLTAIQGKQGVNAAQFRKFVDSYSFFGSRSKLKISPFGDILLQGPNTTYIALPAAMNPIVWEAVHEDLSGGSNAVTTTDHLIPLLNIQTAVVANHNPGSLEFAGTDGQTVKRSAGSESLQTIWDRVAGAGASTGGNNASAVSKTDRWNDRLPGYYSTAGLGSFSTVTSSKYFFSIGSYESGLDKYADGYDVSKDTFGGNGDLISGGPGQIFSSPASARMLLDTTTYYKSDIAYVDFNNGVGFTTSDASAYNEDLHKLASETGKSFKYTAAGGTFAMKASDGATNFYPVVHGEAWKGRGQMSGHSNLEGWRGTAGSNPWTLSASGGDYLAATNRVSTIDNLGAFNDPSKGMNFETTLQPWLQSGGTLGNGDTPTEWVPGVESYNSDPLVLSANTQAGMYVTYTFAAFGSSEQKLALGFRLVHDGYLPPLQGNYSLVADSGASTRDARTDAIRDYLYFALNPSWDHTAYKAQLSVNWINSTLLRWHSDMTGAQSASLLPGSTKTVGFAGFVTTPSLEDVSWTASIVSLYNDYVIWLLIAVAVVLILLAILGTMTWGRMLTSLGIMVLIAYSVVPSINFTVDRANQVSAVAFNDKLSYWAITQQQSYASQIDTASQADSYENYLDTLYANGSMRSTDLRDSPDSMNNINNWGTDNTVLKWPSAGKMYAILNTDLNSGTKEEADKDCAEVLGERDLSCEKNSDGQVVKKDHSGLVEAGIQGWMQNLNGDYYDNKSTYMFRSYNDLSNLSRYMYGSIVGGSNLKSSDSKISYNGTPNTTNWEPDLAYNFDQMGSRFSNDVASGYANSNGGSTLPSSMFRVNLPLSSKIVADRFPDAQSIADGNANISTYYGIPNSYFKMGLAWFNKGVDLSAEQLAATGVDPTTAGYSNSDLAGLATYGLSSESPYYYFSWLLYDQGMSTGTGQSGTFKDVILSKPNQGYFYDNAPDAAGSAGSEYTGEVKDYLDLRSLFTYVIPYLAQGNEVVDAWDRTYGFKYYPGLPLDNPGECTADPEITASAELTQKCWHNINVSQIANLYSPWVDTMYDSSYAQPETITVQGEKVTINNPLDPTYYPESRPMVFSRAEAAGYGLSDSDLTEVERRILQVEDQVQEEYLNLMNYYTFNDSVVNSAAAIQSTFVFNQVFSDKATFGIGASNTLYPQSFDLKSFSYDAFMRPMLASAMIGTGSAASITNTGTDFYQTVVQESSTFTAAFLVVSDALALYVFPILKFGVLLGIFVLALLFVMTFLFRVIETNSILKQAWSFIFKPLSIFLATSIVVSWVFRLLMGKGPSAVTGVTPATIDIGDPAMLLVATILVLSVACVVYFKVVKSLYQGIKQYGTLVALGVATAFSGVATKLIKAAASGKFGGSGGVVDRAAQKVAQSTGAAKSKAQSVQDQMRSGSNGPVSTTEVVPGKKERKVAKKNLKFSKKRPNVTQSPTSDKSLDTKTIDNKIAQGKERLTHSDQATKSDPSYLSNPSDFKF